MKKLIIFCLIIVLILATYASMQAVNYISKPATCANCHALKHKENSLFLSHSNLSINCIDCHSGAGVKEYVDARKAIANVILLEKAKPILNQIFQNASYNISCNLQSNCTKCHAKHSSETNCTFCHRMNGMLEKPDTGFWKKMDMGGHRNKTCEDCHTKSFLIIACTDCHKPHKEEVKTPYLNTGTNPETNSICLACHISPHLPVLNGSFSKDIAKENCAVCHKAAYETLTFYNSKHNQLSSCTSCHPVHREKKTCLDCHGGWHVSHPFAQDNCASCHGTAGCADCHREPHAPLQGLARITTKEQFNDYAATIKAH